MEFEGTKGEWYYDGTSVSAREEVEGDIICESPEAWEESMKNWKANAHLIAAAPELLEMLQKINNINNTAFGLKGFDVKRLKSEIQEVINKALNK